MNLNLHEASEDYLEAIFILEQNNECVRSVDVANIMGVSRPSVNKAIGVLKSFELVEKEYYGLIKLTEKGRIYAMDVAKRHEVLKIFLTDILKVDSKIADEDACKMEHAVSKQTMTNLIQYLNDIVKTQN